MPRLVSLSAYILSKPASLAAMLTYLIERRVQQALFPLVLLLVLADLFLQELIPFLQLRPLFLQSRKRRKVLSHTFPVVAYECVCNLDP